MALIACPECNRQISDSAATCPGCGIEVASAMESRAAGARLSTVQLTSKKFKIHTLIAIGLFVLGVIWMLVESQRVQAGQQGGETPFAVLFMLSGLIWYVVTRIRIWWHHK